MSKEPKVKVISDLLATIAKLGLNFTESQVQKKVKNDLTEKGVLLFLPPTRKIVEVLNDDNPANSDQVKDVILDWVHEDLAAYVQDLGMHLANQTANENQKAVTQFAVNTTVAMLKLYSDDDQDNKAQVVTYFETQLEDPAFRALLMSAIIAPILRKAKAGEDFIELIGKAIEYTLDSVELKK
jgi:hypothetical protein